LVKFRALLILGERDAEVVSPVRARTPEARSIRGAFLGASARNPRVSAVLSFPVP
jgi:hypothetical protein